MKKISTQKIYEIIRNPLVSEKSTYVSQFNYYVFKVSNKSTKPQIKQTRQTKMLPRDKQM